MVLHDHGHGIAFLAGGAARAQDVPGAARSRGLQLGKRRGAQEVELPALAQEVGVVGGDEVDETSGGLGIRARLYKVEVIRERGQPQAIPLA